MNWLLAAAAPAIVGLVLLSTGWIHLAMLAYHGLCASLILGNHARVRSRMPWDRRAWTWGLGVTGAFIPFMISGAFILDPAPYREIFQRTLFPVGPPPILFFVFAAYTLLVHVPLEEIFWRAVVLDVGQAPVSTALAGNFLFFGALHAVPLGLILGPMGILLSVPAGAAGAIWAGLTIRTRSVWPALVSHWGADLVILGGMWFFFIR